MEPRSSGRETGVNGTSYQSAEAPGASPLVLRVGFWPGDLYMAAARQPTTELLYRYYCTESCEWSRAATIRALARCCCALAHRVGHALRCSSLCDHLAPLALCHATTLASPAAYHRSIESATRSWCSWFSKQQCCCFGSMACWSSRVPLYARHRCSACG